MAGRCLSAEHEALASCRVTAQCFEYGRAAAIAADLSIHNRSDFQEVEPAQVVARMQAQDRFGGGFGSYDPFRSPGADRTVATTIASHRL